MNTIIKFFLFIGCIGELSEGDYLHGLVLSILLCGWWISEAIIWTHYS